MKYVIPVFLKLEPERPDDTAITTDEARTAPLTVDQINAEIGTLNEHLAYEARLHADLMFQLRELNREYRERLDNLQARAADIRQQIINLRRTRASLYARRLRHRK